MTTEYTPTTAWDRLTSLLGDCDTWHLRTDQGEEVDPNTVVATMVSAGKDFYELDTEFPGADVIVDISRAADVLRVASDADYARWLLGLELGDAAPSVDEDATVAYSLAELGEDTRARKGLELAVDMAQKSFGGEFLDGTGYDKLRMLAEEEAVRPENLRGPVSQCAGADLGVEEALEYLGGAEVQKMLVDRLRAALAAGKDCYSPEDGTYDVRGVLVGVLEERFGPGACA